MKELKSTKKLIESSYNAKINKTDERIENQKEKLENLKNQIVDASVFDPIIGDMLIYLIRIYEGENFHHRALVYNEYDKSKESFARVLINNKVKINRENNISKLNILVKEGNLIVLNWDMISDDNVLFYYLNDSNDLTRKVKLNKFPYLKEFIDSVISYKIAKNIRTEMSKGELENIKNEFIYSHIDES